MSKYLYGASVQGIQGYIFETNKLKEIAGASELIEQICIKEFENYFSKKALNFDDENLLISAAGNIKYNFDNKEDCEKFVYDFPKHIQCKAPGIVISQAVVKYESDLAKAIGDLEKKLKAKRNMQDLPIGNALMISERTRKTGKAGFGYDKDEIVIDIEQNAKTKFADKVAGISEKLTGIEVKPSDFPYEVDELASDKKGSDNWIAVIHADGNSLGKLIQKFTSQVDKNVVAAVFKKFSIKLEEATKKSAQEAYNEVVKEEIESGKKPPIRPIVIGGDDLTVIIRGDLALDFTNVYLKAFEKNTKSEFKDLVDKYGVNDLKNGLTACAGVSFIKPKYPFHYAVSLAESLCSEAKKDTKAEFGGKSCLNFHKVQSSFVDNFKTLKERELKANGLELYKGPYFIEDVKDRISVDELLQKIKVINQKDAPKGSLRNWLSELYNSKDTADQLLRRIIDLNEGKKDDLGLSNNLEENLHIHDIINLSSIIKNN